VLFVKYRSHDFAIVKATGYKREVLITTAGMCFGNFIFTLACVQITQRSLHLMPGVPFAQVKAT
jgi:hypothetical protein